MGQCCRRRQGVRANVCALLVALLGLLSAAQARAQPFVLAGGETAAGAVVYPARGDGPARVTVVLHGMCGHPENTCRYFADQITQSEHLICPRATRACDGGGASWPQVGFEGEIEQAVARAEAALGPRVDPAGGRTLIGYSLGAFRALELAEHGAGKYPRVMLIGARIFPNRRLLRESGVERLLFSAGRWDMTHEHMLRESARLARGGFMTRFLDLGPVGHAFTPTFVQYLPEGLAWLHAAS